MGNKREAGQQPGFSWWRDLPSWLQALTGILGLLILVAGGSGAAAALHSQRSGSDKGAANGGHTASPGNHQSSGPTSSGPSGASVWTGPISISGSNNGLDLNSRPPATGTSSNLGFNGSILYSDSSSFQIATWTRSSTPSRDQCNTWAQTHPASQQPAETGSGYCIITGQGHTAYLQVTNINSNVAGGTVYANLKTWNTTGPSGSSVPITAPAYAIWFRGPISISYAGSGIDLDSKRPASGPANNNLVFNGTILYSDGSSFQIATWTSSSTPTGAQCHIWAQTHPASQQPAETGDRYCIITGQGHTAYLQVTNVNPDAGGTLHASVTVWAP